MTLIISNNLYMAPIATVSQHGPAIRALRIKDGLTVNGLAELVGCAQSVISHLEMEQKQPSEQMLNRIARALHVPVAAISRAPLADIGEVYEEADAPQQRSA
ncbi:helix-turn-helix domain-containing protein [Nonomuraea sp. NPDC049269]|uniref:helix-turn-helix domain-containing protein n=1 Tax=Nonomuraea sp. NPDC049269 TaxID=3364349 RepID=UPI00371D372C